jgi:hypothetical protein
MLNMEASMRGKRSLVFYNELKSNWEKELYIEVCTQEGGRKDGVTHRDAKKLEVGDRGW